MSDSKSAPDVDLQSQGLPKHLVVAGASIVLAVYLASQPSASDEAAESQGSTVAWVARWVLWAVLRLAQMLAGLAVLLLAVLIVRQRSILYVPVPPGTQRSPSQNPPMYRSPRTWNLPYEDVWVTAADGTRLHAWFVYQPKASCAEAPYTLVYFHGNAGNIGHRLENVRDMHARLRVNILILDYRGYGDSGDGGGPSQRGFMQDALATYRWLVERSRRPPEGEPASLSADRVLFFGRSIGGAVAVLLFAELLRDHLRKAPGALPLPAGLVLENTFTSLGDMAVQVFPFLSFARPILRSPVIFDEWSSLDALEDAARQHPHWCCCLLSGLQDQIVPPAQMRQLHAVLKQHRPQVLKYFIFQNGGHNDTPQRGGEEYWSSFQRFMALVAEGEEERRKALEAPSG